MGPVLETFEGPLSRKRRFIRNLAMIGACVLIVGILAWKLCLVSSPVAVPALAKQWHEQIYSLDDDETIRFIPPPYTPERMRLSQKQLGFAAYRRDQTYEISRDYWYLMHGLHGIRPGVLNFGNILMPPRPIANPQAAMEFACLGRWPDVVVPPELQNLSVDGDWIVRRETPLGQRIMALQSVLKLVTGRDLVIEYLPVERDVEENWSLRLDNQEEFKLIKDRELQLGIVMREQKPEASQGAHH